MTPMMRTRWQMEKEKDVYEMQNWSGYMHQQQGITNIKSGYGE